MLRGLTPAGSVFVATSSSNPRALAAEELAARAAPFFQHVEAIQDPVEALARAHELSKPVLVTGSLYLLADLVVRQKDVPWKNLVRG
jgi:folylpolyglutamate synthase/dihydropteroate synthase